MKATEGLMDALMKNPAMLGGAVLLVVVLLVVILKVAKGKGDAAPEPAKAPGKGTNIAAKGEESAPQKTNVAAKGPAAAGPAKDKDPFKDEPDPRLVTQYQEGTGEGIEEIEARLKEDPNNEDLLDWLAFMYYSNGKLEKAIETYQRAINLNYENEHQHYYLGNAFYKLGKNDRAVEEWEVVVQLKPESKLAQNAAERISKVRQLGK